MSLIYRTVGDVRPIPFTVTPAAVATPTVTLYDDLVETVPHGGTSPSVTGSGFYWGYDLLPAALPAGTFYGRVNAVTGSGPVTTQDTLVITAASIETGGTGLVTLAQVRKQLNYDDPTDTDDDAEILFWTEVASGWIRTQVSAGDLTNPVVQGATLQLIDHLWESQRGPTAGGPFTRDSGEFSLGLKGFAIPTRVAELLAPFAPVTSPRGCFPSAAAFPDPVENTQW